MKTDDLISRLNTALEGRYHVDHELGEGGMATVFVARDERHHRNVALKVLKPELAAAVGAERFLAEIETTAGLQHPHVLPLFDSGEADGFLYYVMPYVDGESLRERLEREGPLPVHEAVDIAVKVAHALDVAHEAGVVHRDIKPANILLSRGEPLVADFGIALAAGAATTGRLTETGLTLGTPYYMSPEQATGDVRVGPATDTYALGCVLYEMLVGEPPYMGNTPQAVLGKIITQRPSPVTEQRGSVPLNVAAAVQKALEKLPADRFRSGVELAKALSDPDFRHGMVGARGKARLWNPLSVALAGLVVVLLALTMRGAAGTAPDEARVRRYTLGLGESNVRGADQAAALAIADDGSKIAYVGLEGEGVPVLWLQDFRRLQPRRLVEDPSLGTAFFAPDGDRLAVTRFGERTLEIVSLTDGGVTAFADGVNSLGGAWEDGWLYFTGTGFGIERMSEATRERQQLTDVVEEGAAGHGHPGALPNGAGVLYTVIRLGDRLGDSEIAVYDIAADSSRVLTAGIKAVYVDPGRLVVLRVDGAVVSAPFDIESLEITGPFISVLEGVSVGGRSGHNFALSPTGDLVYTTSSSGAGDRELVWVQRDGSVQPVDAGWRAPFETVSISPDGSRLATSTGGEFESTVWVRPFSGARQARLSLEPGSNRRPRWMPDGRSVAFISDRSGNRVPYSRAADGTSEASIIVEHPAGVDQIDFSSDGEWIVYRVGYADAEKDVLARRRTSNAEPIVVSAVPGVDELAPAVSPDGRYVAYASNETGQYEIWVRAFPDVARGRWQVSTDGGLEPVWGPDGGELFYRADGDLVAARVGTDPSFVVLSVDVLFTDPEIYATERHATFDVAADGRFLMIRQPALSSELLVYEGFRSALLGEPTPR